MAETTAAQIPEDRKPSLRVPLFAGLVLALLGAGGAFYATWSGMVPPSSGDSSVEAAALPDIAFVPIEPVVVSLPVSTGTRQLRFSAQIEVESGYAAEVTSLMPRILDVMNAYLRAIEPARFEEPGALLRVRSQLLRRLQIVTGEGRVRDLLVSEFVMQ